MDYDESADFGKSSSSSNILYCSTPKSMELSSESLIIFVIPRLMRRNFAPRDMNSDQYVSCLDR